MQVLTVQGLSKSYRGIKAVDRVDLTVSKGELLALIGPNGAGKTTCFNMLNGQIAPDAGKIALEGKSLAGLHPRTIWKLGVSRTFQITQIFGSMTVLENLQVALLSHHNRLSNMLSRADRLYREEAMELLARVGMADQAGRACGVLAYGDLKRVELAVALANKPKLLLLDEPMAGMAPNERIQLMDLIAKVIREHRVAVLFTEHDMDIVFSHADRIVVLNRGSVIAHGDAAEIRDNREVRDVYLGSGKLYH